MFPRGNNKGRRKEWEGSRGATRQMMQSPPKIRLVFHKIELLSQEEDHGEEGYHRPGLCISTAIQYEPVSSWNKIHK